MKFTYSVLAVVVTLMSTGCSIFQHKENLADTTEARIQTNLDLAISQIEATQAELYQAGAISQQKTGISGGIYDDNQKLTLDWNGDAKQLVQKLAKQRSYSFAATGVVLPLPININVNNMSYRNVMERIQTQIGYRAGIQMNNNTREVLLNYTSPTAKPADKRQHTISQGQGSYQTYTSTRYSPSGTAAPVITPKPSPASSGSMLRDSGGFDNSVARGSKCNITGELKYDAQQKAVACRGGKWVLLK